jgi:hypothetical protein
VLVAVRVVESVVLTVFVAVAVPVVLSVIVPVAGPIVPSVDEAVIVAVAAPVIEPVVASVAVSVAKPVVVEVADVVAVDRVAPVEDAVSSDASIPPSPNKPGFELAQPATARPAPARVAPHTMDPKRMVISNLVKDRTDGSQKCGREDRNLDLALYPFSSPRLPVQIRDGDPRSFHRFGAQWSESLTTLRSNDRCLAISC